MRRAALALVCGFLALPANAQVRIPDFSVAETVFNERHDLRTRIVAQVFLIATGHQNSVPTEKFGLRTFGAIKRFQNERGLLADGVLTTTTMDRLTASAEPMLSMWNFKLISHPFRGRPIWMPQGLALRAIPNKNGLTFQDAANRLKISYNFLPSVQITPVYEAVLDKRRQEGHTIHYSVIKDGWFVVSATSPSGEDQYLRFHQDGDGVLGFALYWNNANGDISGDRIAILMSASLGSVMNGRPMVEPPSFRPQVATTTPLQVPVPVQPATRETPSVASTPPLNANVSPPAPTRPIAPKAEEKGISTGTGFFVDNKGNLVTNAHVVKDCNTVAVKLNDSKPAHKARIVATDSSNDLALLLVENAAGNRFASLRPNIRLGEGIAVFGYPHADILASSGNFTIGNVTALSGLADDSRYYQISAPVQQGNSGGPLLDSYGNAVGVVAAKLNVLKVALSSGDFPQNINFAIKSNMLGSFLESNQVVVQQGNTSGAKLDPADLADTAKAMTGFVACQ